jgi:hypothetical protein
VVPDNGVDAVCVCGLLLASCDDEAARFGQEREREHSRGQVSVVHRWLRLSLCSALVLVTTVATAMMAMAITPASATSRRDVALPWRSDAIAMCNGEGARVFSGCTGAGVVDRVHLDVDTHE